MPQETALIQYTLHLADDALILGHRNSEWTGHGPILEQDIALSNIALDLIGQARYLYQYAATLINEDPSQGIAGRRPDGPVTEDDLAFMRDGWDFRNCLLVEQRNGDWARTLVRQFFFSAYQLYLYEGLQRSNDTQVAAIAEKSYKEVLYHLRWSSEWVIRLGDGTEESHRRMVAAVEDCWKYTGELFAPVGYEAEMASAGIGIDLIAAKAGWQEKVQEVFAIATLPYPAASFWMQTGGKEGRHTEELGYLLAEMQFLQRAYPGCEW